ncbi:dicarboxylate/amino acid:cation symporter [Lysobacter sp. A03]|uniref:dicarboxylate/amino acid:cation symporter n=1 Tax=Lysobacter sp. A03 TaxID=1199154 RepID=UPI0005B719ED|nr:dicarboxylate/amino acid:cation symporter [Lysobacter sp. A03]KIQ96147.1 Na+/H+-dicarboxylate symporter [Lysobacter sp. A03]
MTGTSRVLLALALGALIGLGLAWVDPEIATRVADVVHPFGRLWLNALQMTVVPLVLALVVVGVSTAADAAASGRIARNAILVFIALLALAAVFTAIAAPALLSMLPHDPSLAVALGGGASETAALPAPAGWSQWVTGIVPSNAVEAAANGAMLPLVVFALFFGFALTRIEGPRRALMVEFFQALADAMIMIVRWVLWAAPLGVFALILAVTARAGMSMLSALGIYIALQCFLYLTVAGAMVLVAVVWGGESIRRFSAAIAPAQVVAASTQSSLASLPAMLEVANDRLRYPRQISGLVLPMAVTLFRITSPVQYLSAAAFIAWAYGIDLGVAQLAAGCALAVVISLGSVGLPGQVSYMATNLPVAQAMGLPVAPLGLLLAVDTIPDVFATLGNVTADLAATSIVAKAARGDAIAPDSVEP